MALSDSAAKKLGMAPAMQQPNPAPSWRMCSLSKGGMISTEKLPVGSMPVSGIEPKQSGWLHRVVLRAAKSFASPRFGTLVGSERQHVSAGDIPGEDWAEWDEFARKAEQTLDMLGVMNT